MRGHTTSLLFVLFLPAVSSTDWTSLPIKEWDTSKCGKALTFIKKEALAAEKCSEVALNVTRLRLEAELIAAYLHNTLADFLAKYCEKVSVVIPCLDKFALSIAPCLDDKRNEDVEISIRAIEAGANFLCNKKGSRIVNFMNEGGGTCTYKKLEEIGTCVKSVFNINTLLSVHFLLNITFDDTICPHYNSVMECFEHSLGTCSSQSTLETIKDTTHVMLQVTPCNKMSATRLAASSSAPAKSTTSLSVVGLLYLILHVLRY